jgi:hypothetical protein
VVALKVMRPERADSTDAERRFSREAHAVAQLRHPSIVTVFDAGVERADGTGVEVRYLAMEMVPGSTLSDVLGQAAVRGEVLPVARIVRWGARLARALEYAHGRGIVHRDVKPENIRITPEDRPLLLDFGIAVDMTVPGPTVTQGFRGSPAYAAPEQVNGGLVDGRTDVHALGVTLYQALTGTAPFAAATVERTLHRVLHETPSAPRRLAPRISKDLDTVIRKAMEKQPAQRYASAGAFADDLEAVLDYRPVRARPASVFARLGKWARRRPAPAVALASAVLFALLLTGLGLVQAAQRQRDRREEALRLLDRATTAVAAYRAERLDALERESELARQQADVLNRYFTDAEDRALATLEIAVEEGQRARDALFHDVLGSLQRAERLAPGLGGANAVRAALYVEKWEEARTARDPVRQAFFRQQAEFHDPHGEAATRFARSATLGVHVTPESATCWVFEFREQREVVVGGGRRLVPVPVHTATAPPVPYGTVVLRVVQGNAQLAVGDLVLEIEGHPVGESLLAVRGDGSVVRLEGVDDRAIHGPADLEEALEYPGPHRFRLGGVEHVADGLASLGVVVQRPEDVAARGNLAARVLCGGAVRDIRLAPGLSTRRTATPLFPSEEAIVRATPRTLPLGCYLLVARAPGYEEARAAVTLHPQEAGAERFLHLQPEGSTPAGFVRVPADEHGDEFLIMEREVTCEEYLAFLEAPGTRERIEVGVPALVPRGPLGDWDWALVEGRMTWGRDWRADTAVMGVSLDDARAYIAWRSACDGVAYALPSEAQWNRASGHWLFQRTYPFGNVFSPKWVSSNWARPRARPEPTYRYPVDESPFGVYGTAGSAMEWLDAWWDKDKTLHWLAGGAWGYADPAVFRSPGGWGSRADKTTGTYGFRLVRSP